MATGGLYGQSSAGIVSPQSGSESSGLYGNNTVFGGTYFEWFIFQVADTQPATPTGGSWSFTTNSGTPPSGWLGSPPANPTNTVWVSVGLVNSKSSSAIEWSSPGKFSFASGLPILSGASEPTSGDGQSDQLYIQTNTAPETIWFKQAGTWTRLTGSSLYVDLTSNQTIAGTKTFSSEIQGSISGNAANVTGIVDITHGGTGSTTASAARTALGAAASGANADITSMSGVTGGITTPDYITFDVNPSTVPTAPGSLYWDSADGNQTLSLVMAGGNATQQIGEEQYYRIKASAAITEGQVVMFTGTVGASGALTGAPATGLTASTASYVMGVATQNMALNDWGYVTSFGLVRNINTNAWAAGTILYYDPTVAGGLTSTLPSAPNAKVQVCAVIYQSASNGSLFVRPSFGGILGQYEGDVGFTSTTAGDVIVRNSGNTVWENKAQSTLIAGNVSGTVAIANGGTGQTTANAAFNALAPSQTGNSGKYLTTDGSNTSWATNPLGTVTSVDASGGTTGLTFSGGPITTSGTLTLAGTLGTANGGTNLTSFTANGVMYASSTSVLTTGSALQFDGANLGVGVTPSAWGLFTGLQVGPSGSISNNGTGTPVTVVSNNAYYNGTSWAYINTAAASQYQLSTSQHIWRYAASGSGNITWSEGMRLDASGNLGIGTSTDTGRLNVYSASTETQFKLRADSGQGSSIYFTQATAGFNGYINYDNAANYLRFGVNGSERVRIDSSGNLTVGNTTANVWTNSTYSGTSHISAYGSGEQNIGVQSSSSNATRAKLFATTDAFGIWADGSTFVPFKIGYYNQEWMRIDASGNLGLGVAPSAWTNTGKTIQFKYAAVSSDNATDSIELSSNAYYDGSWKYIQAYTAGRYAISNGAHSWYTAATGAANTAITFTQAMTLNASGNLGLGVTPNTWYLNTSVYKAFQFGSSSLFFGNTTASSSNVTLYANAYLDTSAVSKYLYSSYASKYGQSSGVHTWSYAASGTAGGTVTWTDAMTLDASGNLGVGTTSPSSYGKFAVVGSGTTTTVVDSGSSRVTTQAVGTGGSYTQYYKDLTPTYVASVGAYSPATSAAVSGIVFADYQGGWTERARIDSSGNLLVAKTAASSSVVGWECRPNGEFSSTMSASTNGTVTNYVYSTGAAAARFYVGMGGTVYATSTTITAISDQRLKENIRDLDDGLDVVMALKPRKFDWKEGKGQDIKNARGFIAQEFEEVLPDMIEEWRDPAPEGEEPYKAINANLIPTLVKAIQEQQAIITQLQADVAALKGN